MKYHLDGAHTVESMTACINWFQVRSFFILSQIPIQKIRD